MGNNRVEYMGRPAFYRLEGRKPVPADHLAELTFLHNGIRKSSPAPGVDVSTVFLAVDHNWTGNGPPILFETMIFGGPLDGWQDRCSTYDEAEAMHACAESLAKAAPEQKEGTPP